MKPGANRTRKLSYRNLFL